MVPTGLSTHHFFVNHRSRRASAVAYLHRTSLSHEDRQFQVDEFDHESTFCTGLGNDDEIFRFYIGMQEVAIVVLDRLM